MDRAKNWCFTLNNPSSNEINYPDTVKYAIWQREQGEEGTIHLQGYVEFTNSTRLSQCKTILPRAHWEIRRGTQLQAKQYASKEDTRMEGPWEHGTYVVSEPGRRNDIRDVQELIKAGKPMLEVCEQFPEEMARYHNYFKWYKTLIKEPRQKPPSVYILVGKPGTGKSSFCRRNAPGAYWKQNESKWWDGYDGERDVVLDDFYGWLQYTTMLRLLDRYPVMVESKGGNRYFAAERIFITSNVEPREWYRNLPDIDALDRRLNEFGQRITDFTINLINEN